MKRAHSWGGAIAGKQQAAPDHIDRADDDRWPRGIGLPFAIVRMFSPQRTDRERRCVSIRLGAQRTQTTSDLTHNIRNA
jgi:hypothetical protein